jgi:predicted dehydrogenase
MGREYLKALNAIGVGHVRVCSLSSESLGNPELFPNVEIISGGFELLNVAAEPTELAVVATPTDSLIRATDKLVSLGFRHLLVEKPIALDSGSIDRLKERMALADVDARCAHNRLSYPSFVEVASRSAEEGGITSCSYAFTEMVKPDWPDRFPAEELEHWGIANSLHVIGMAHGLIGLPAHWQGFRQGKVKWHPAGEVFVGAGVSQNGIPFSYHADWGSKSRWAIEVHTRHTSYRLCPIEKAFYKTQATADWSEIPLTTVTSDVKAGIVEQVAAMLDPAIADIVHIPTLNATADLTRFAEELFGYIKTS